MDVQARQAGMKIFALVSIIAIATLIVDTMINQVADFLVPQITSNFGIASFTVIVILSAIGQYFFLEFIKRKISEIRARAIYLKILRYAVTIVQYALLGILAFMLFQILVMSQYPVSILTAATVLSYTLNAVLMDLFAYRFFAWYRSNRYSIAGIFYGLANAWIFKQNLLRQYYHLLFGEATLRCCLSG